MKTPRKYFLINLASILMMIVSFSLTFVAGMFAENTKIESCARDVVNIVNSKVPTKDLLGVTVEAGESTTLPNSEDQFYKLYGVFRQEKITFASGYNLTKQDDVRIDDLDPNFNFPVAYLQYTQSSPVYDRGHKHYKDDVYPIELMFPYDSEGLSAKKIVISDIHARSLLKTKKGIIKPDDKYTDDDYRLLLKDSLEVKVNGTPHDFIIQSIFYSDTYYVEGLYHTIGDFFFTSVYFPTIKKQNLYFMNNFEYENKYFMEYLNKLYDRSNYRLNCVQNTLPEEINETIVTNFFYVETKNTVFLEAILLIVSVVYLAVSLFFSIAIVKEENIYWLLLKIMLAFVPFATFFAISNITKSILLFSYAGTLAHFILMSIYLVAVVVAYIVTKIKVKNGERIDGIDI